MEPDHFPEIFQKTWKAKAGKGSGKNNRRKRGHEGGPVIKGKEVPYRLVWGESESKEYRENMEDSRKEMVT